jgi:hypothetical protein
MGTPYKPADFLPITTYRTRLLLICRIICLNGCSPQSPLFIAGSRRTIRLTYSKPTKNPRCLQRGFFNMKKYDNDLGFSLFIILALLLSPICWNYYFTLLLISFVILIKELLKKNNVYEILLFAASLLLMSVDAFSDDFRKMIYIVHRYVLGPHSSFIDTLTLYSLQFYGLLLLLILNFHLINKQGQNHACNTKVIKQ